MKNILFLVFTILFCVLFIGCENEQDGFPDDFSIILSGEYSLNLDKIEQGTIYFNNDGTFTMKTIRGNVSYGDYNFLPNNENIFVITWAEDEDGNEILTDEDYENGGLKVLINAMSNTDCLAKNLPYYKGEELFMYKKH